ncbi:aquaporin [Candidatus Peregrinibacteria bacterium]|nr:aquaporin [Candidatus Peregrinibacteria bacterium]MBI3816981.1 aquaporin [Candidatus Peregrinibacteria bacterium]
MDFRRYAAELIGTFTLTLVVWLSIGFAMPIATPVAASLTLCLFVYTIGTISGAHINPAVTVGLLSINKIKAKDAVFYVIAQLLGALLAMNFGHLLNGGTSVIGHEESLSVGIMEALGAFFLVFGICAVVYKKVHAAAAGIVIGGSLLLGIDVASPVSNAVLNPAVALGIGSFGPMYILGPIVGAVFAAWLYTFVAGEKVEF